MHFMSPNFHESHKCLKNQLGKEEQLVFSEILQKPIEAIWSSIKRSMKKLVGTHLYQYVFRRFHNNEKIFQNIFEEIRHHYPL